MQQHGAWQAAEINVVRTINERLYNLTAQTAKKNETTKITSQYNTLQPARDSQVTQAKLGNKKR